MMRSLQKFLRPRPRFIRLREPEMFRLVTGADRERIEATFDAGGRIVSLIVHTRSRSLRNDA
jgi:hypothetical protein